MVRNQEHTYLQFKALIQHHPALNPGLLQVCTLLVKNIKFLLDLRAGIVSVSQQLLSKLLKCLESASPGIDFCPVFLPKGGKGLGKLAADAHSDVNHRLTTKGGNEASRALQSSHVFATQQAGPPTWCRSSNASAPVTSLASSSEDTNPRIPLIQDMRSLETSTPEK